LPQVRAILEFFFYLLLLLSLFLIILHLQKICKIMLAIIDLPCAMVDWILLIGGWPQKTIMLQYVGYHIIANHL
jgi:hypothetical protein